MIEENICNQIFNILKQKNPIQLNELIKSIDTFKFPYVQAMDTLFGFTNQEISNTKLINKVIKFLEKKGK